MFERYTETARRTIFFARYEASQFGSQTIETEHLLLGLFREDRALGQHFLGEPVAGDSGQEIVPLEIAELQERIQSIVHRMENAIANHNFPEARAFSDEERQERENLRQLYEKHKLANWSTGFIPETGRLTEIRKRIESETGRRPKSSTSADLPLSKESKRVLAYAAEESVRLDHKTIGTEHLFLGLLREEKSLAARILTENGLKLNLVRAEIAARPVGEETRPTPSVNFEPRLDFSRSPAGLMYALQDASRVAFMARHEAAQRQSPCIETTDLLLALTREKDVNERFLGPAEAAIKNLKPEPRREKVALGELAFSEDCKLVFGFTAEEAAQLGQRTAPAHLLLGILRVENCAAAGILRECGLTAAGVRAQLSPHPLASNPEAPSSDPEQGRNYV